MTRTVTLAAMAGMVLTWLSMGASAQAPHWSYPYAPYGYGPPAAPVPPGHHVVPTRPLPRASVPGSGDHRSAAVVAPGTLALSQLGRELRRIGYATVYKAERHDNHWEFLAEGGGNLAVIMLDPHTGRFLSKKSFRPAPGLAFSDVVNRLEKEGYGPIREVEFEDGVWEIETDKDGETVDLIVRLVSDQVQIHPND